MGTGGQFPLATIMHSCIVNATGPGRTTRAKNADSPLHALDDGYARGFAERTSLGEKADGTVEESLNVATG
jgi:hypothetical protein